MEALTPDETILGLLAIEAKHGYDLLECFRRPEELGRVWNISTSQVYAVLKRLEGQGLIAGCDIPSPNAPVRTQYTLTEAGKERLMGWLYEQQPSASVRRVRVEFLSRLYVARRLLLPTAQIVESQQKACRRRRDELAQQRIETAPGVSRLAVGFVIAQLDAVLRWIERCEIVPFFEEENSIE